MPSRTTLSVFDKLSQSETRSIIEAFKTNSEDMLTDDELYERLYEHYLPEMPYGIAKARDGDPGHFILDRLYAEALEKGYLQRGMLH